MQKLIINAAITGMVPTQKQNPYLPCTVEEIVKDVKRCRDAGASIIHVHARDKDGNPSHRGDIYKELFKGIRQECPDILISGSASGRVYPDLESRSEVMNPGDGLRPDFASLTLGSLNFPTQASINQPQVIQGLARRMNALGIVPELEIFDFGMIDYAKYLIHQKILQRPFYCNLLLGSLGTSAATAQNLSMMVQALPEGATWSAAGIGKFQFTMNCLAIAMGGHVRVGLEDNLWMDTGRTRLASNAGLIDRVVKVARSMEREIAAPNEAREIIGLCKSIHMDEPRVPIVELDSVQIAQRSKPASV